MSGRALVLLGINVNFQYASIPKRHRARIVACLESIVEALETTELRAVLFFTGVSAEWLSEHRPSLVERLRALVDAGKTVGGSHTYAHAVLTLLPERDQLWQVQWGERAVRETFGSSGQGLFVPEFGFGERTGAYLAAAGGTDYVVGPLGRRACAAFRLENGLKVIRPSARASYALKAFLMGGDRVPKLAPAKTHCVVADAEYPYFSREVPVRRWAALFAEWGRRYDSELIDAWLERQELREMRYRPRIPPKHKRWFRGIEAFDESLARARDAAGDHPSSELVRRLLLAENSDGYECMTQGYVGHEWDVDARAALSDALRMTRSPSAAESGSRSEAGSSRGRRPNAARARTP